MPNILLIDDEPAIQHAVRKAFHLPEFETVAVRTASEGLQHLSDHRPDVVLLDIHLPDADGLQAFERIRALDSRIPVVLITGHGTTELAIEAMKRGAFEYLLKPLKYDLLKDVIDKACITNRRMRVPALVADADPFPEKADVLIGRCEAMQAVYKAIGRVAETDTTVLILGDSGTGKELVARALYQHSRRADKPFLAINCGAIPETLVESELFGHERGAFTNADRKRIGKFEQCNEGTIFLDEISEMPPLAQVKLLRLLQEQQFERVGGNETINVNVRVIAATNTNLEERVTAGRFRQDLFFRLNVFQIKLPPLRDRGADLDLLIDHYVNRFSREFGRMAPTVAEESRASARTYSWPGNVRELQSVLKQAMLLANGSVLSPEYFPFTALSATAADSPQALPAAERPTLDWDRFVDERWSADSNELYAESLLLMERQVLTRVMQRTGWNQLRAAERLGITRSSLRHKLRALGILPERGTVNDEGE